VFHIGGIVPGIADGPGSRQADPVANGSDHAELSSLHSQLEEVTTRVVAVADRYRDTPDSALTAELDAAERNLLTARRAVQRAIKELA
jgi:hypothetical protein